jgi:raffinose/stachyose/melibiose transport system substrate-binding protein
MRKSNRGGRLLVGLLAVVGFLAVSLGGGSGAAAASKAAALTLPIPTFAQACGNKPITLQGYFESGFPDIVDLTAAFTKQYPSVKWKVTLDPFATITQDAALVLGGPNPPDLIRLPILVGLVKDHLLLNLNSYFEAYHWNTWPASEWAQNRTSANGVGLGSGNIYAWGLNNQVTGVFYNKALAAKIGMKNAPTTLAALEADFAKAKAAGITPIDVFNGGSTGGLVFPLQQLMADYSSATAINNWVFYKAGANIDTSADVQAATVLQKWIQAGYFNPDANAVLYAQMMSDFDAGQALFIFDGDWESGGFDTNEPGKIGFFPMPPLKAGGPVAAMSGPLQYGIAAHAEYPNCTAFFLNWVSTNKTARAINVKIGGSNPGGPASLPIPTVKPGSTTSQTLAAGLVVAKDNGDMDFIANANGSIYAEGWTPEVQKLFAGRETPQGLLHTVQADYVAEGS